MADPDQSEPTHVSCEIEVMKGRNQGDLYALSGESVTIGRAPGNTIRLRDMEVSATHAELTWKDNGYYLRDADSHTGTRINGKPSSSRCSK